MRRILLVDDDSDWACAAADWLRGQGYETQIAADGRQALNLFQQTRPHLVVLDLHLPTFNGLEVLHELRDSGSEIPVVIVSADDRSAGIGAAMAAGANRFLRKPLTAELLLRAVQGLIEAEPPSSDPMW